MITLRCANCGAPLEVDDHASLAKCQYCQATTRVRDRTLQMAATAPAAPPTPSGYGPPPPAGYGPPPPAEWPAPPAAAAAQARHAVPAQKSSNSGCVLLAVCMLLFSGVGAGIGVYGMQHGGNSVLGGTGGGGGGLFAPEPVREVCLVDANGDTTLDVAVLRADGDVLVPQLFDGTTGSSTWRGDSIPSGTKLLCSGHHVVLALEDFNTRVIDARAPATPLVVRGSDVTRSVRAGTGCLDLVGADDSHLSVAVDGSNATACPTERPRAADRSHYGPGILGMTDHEIDLHEGTDTLQLTSRRHGTEMLSVRLGERAPAQLTTLKTCSFTSAIAANPTMVFLQGCAPGPDQGAVAVGLRRPDLGEMWRVSIGESPANSIRWFSWNGSALIVEAQGAVYAYDGTTGATLWSVK